MSILRKRDKTLILGSLTLDVILRVKKLPQRMQDMNVDSQTYACGGCAYNVYQAMKYCNSDAVMAAVVGTGIYGDEIKRQLKQDRTMMLFAGDEANGCCYCLVEEDGERTFLSLHGAEYLYPLKELQTMDLSSFRYVYVCGIDLEEKKNEAVLNLIDQYPDMKLFFAPGPRLLQLDRKLWKKMMSRHPVLHLNEKEAKAVTAASDVKAALQELYRQSQTLVIVTMGAEGCMAYDGSCFVCERAVPCDIIDTIGAGDAHAGACLHALEQGMDLKQMLQQAAGIASRALHMHGSLKAK